jgi:putative ABC transport system permease protein
MPRQPEKKWLDLPSRSNARIAADVQAELEAWIDERAAELRARGMKAEDAQSQATREFGDKQLAQRTCVEDDRALERRSRLHRLVGELRADVRMAWRMAIRAPATTVVLLLTFALGIGATTAIYSAVHAVLLRPLPYDHEEALLQLQATDRGEVQPSGQVSVGTMIALRDGVRTLSGIAAIGGGGYTLVDDGEPEMLEGARVSANTFDVLGSRPALGRTFVTGDDSVGAEPMVVLSDALWRRRFGGDVAVVGRRINLNGTMRRVVGVMPPGFIVPSMGAAQLWVPLDVSSVLRDPNRSRKFRFLRLFARVRDGVTAEAVQTDVDGVLANLARNDVEGYGGRGARVASIRSAVTGSARPALLVLMGAALLLLAIACANVAAVLLTRTLSRQHELAVRTALGAGRGRLVRQLLAESLTLAVVGGTLGVALAAVALRLLRTLGSRALPEGITVSLEWPVLVFALGVIVVSGVGFGLLPTLASARALGATLSGLSGRSSGTRRRATLRRALVAGQLALCVALLMSAGLLARSLGKLVTLDLGYRTERVLTFSVSLPGSRYAKPEQEDQFWEALLSRLRGLPGVEVAGSAGTVPLGGGAGAGLAIEGKPVEDGRLPEVRYVPASDDYFSVLRIPLISGRTFAAGDRAGSPRVVLISRSAAVKFWGSESPLGARVRLGPDPSEPWNEVVGVVGDVREGSEGEPKPTAYVSQRQDHWGGGIVVLRVTNDPSTIVAAARAALHDLDPMLPVIDMRTLDEMHALSLSGRRLPLALMGTFSLVALVLASVGVYGVGANVVASRKRELGIRMALGASRGGVLALILGESVRMIAAGLVFGIPLALLLASQVRSLLFQVSATDAWTLAAVAVLLVVVALAAGFLPARRATRVDPLEVLRSD